MLKPRISVKLLSHVRKDETRRRAARDDSTVGGGDENTAIRKAKLNPLNPPIAKKTMKCEGAGLDQAHRRRTAGIMSALAGTIGNISIRADVGA
jgi:hypothetical protein